jgi:hypothetical protein
MLLVVGYSITTPSLEATSPFAGANSTESRVTEIRIWEDGRGSLHFKNGTKLSFYHDFLGETGYLYQNGTIQLGNRS